MYSILKIKFNLKAFDNISFKHGQYIKMNCVLPKFENSENGNFVWNLDFLLDDDIGMGGGGVMRKLLIHSY